MIVGGSSDPLPVTAGRLQVQETSRHLLVGGVDAEHVQHVVRVADQVECARRHLLRPVCAVQQGADQEGAQLVEMVGVGRSARFLTSPGAAGQHPQQQRRVVPQVRYHVGQHTAPFAPAAAAQEAGETGQRRTQTGVGEADGHEPAAVAGVEQPIWETVGPVQHADAIAEQADGGVVDQETDVGRLDGDGAEGVRGAGDEWVEAAGEQVADVGPDEGVARVQRAARQRGQHPDEVERRQEVGPEVHRLVGGHK